MHYLALFLILLSKLSAQALPLVPMRMDPDQLLRSLRDKTPAMPRADCGALDLPGCQPEEPVSDISLRWVQLDDDPELEAILITETKAARTYFAFVFDKQAAWNMVGNFNCYRNCDVNQLIRVQRLTGDSPSLLLLYRDL